MYGLSHSFFPIASFLEICPPAGFNQRHVYARRVHADCCSLAAQPPNPVSLCLLVHHPVYLHVGAQPRGGNGVCKVYTIMNLDGKIDLRERFQWSGHVKGTQCAYVEMSYSQGLRSSCEHNDASITIIHSVDFLLSYSRSSLFVSPRLFFQVTDEKILLYKIFIKILASTNIYYRRSWQNHLRPVTVSIQQRTL